MASQHEVNRPKKTDIVPTPLRRRSNLRPVVEIYWSSINADSIRLAIDAITRAGGAVMFGRTSDGGALSLCILDGADKIKEYPHDPQQAEDILASIVAEWVGL